MGSFFPLTHDDDARPCPDSDVPNNDARTSARHASRLFSQPIWRRRRIRRLSAEASHRRAYIDQNPCGNFPDRNLTADRLAAELPRSRLSGLASVHFPDQSESTTPTMTTCPRRAQSRLAGLPTSVRPGERTAPHWAPPYPDSRTLVARTPPAITRREANGVLTPTHPARCRRTAHFHATNGVRLP